MKFRLRLAAWWGLSLVLILGLLIFTAHRHLDHELREQRWERSHPSYPRWVLHGSYTDDEIHDILGELLSGWALVGIPALLLALGSGLVLAGRSIRPIKVINRQLAAMQPDALKRGIAVPENDPSLAQLVAHLNALLQRVGRAYDEISEYSTRVAHELRTPLMLLRMRIEQAADQIPPEFADELQDELGRLSKFVERSLLAARAASGRMEVNLARVSLTELLEELREDYDVLAGEKGLQAQWRIQPGLSLVTDEDLLRHVLHNVLGNAIRYGSSRHRVRAFRHGSGVVVSISNRSDAKVRPAGGPGLGLRIVRSLVSALPGSRFRVREGPSRFGVRLFFLDMPDANRPPARAADHAAP